jgi:hypothetical protein
VWVAAAVRVVTAVEEEQAVPVDWQAHAAIATVVPAETAALAEVVASVVPVQTE